MAKLCTIIIFCLYIQACCGDQDLTPTQRNATPQCVWCPKKTTTHRTTTHSTLHTTHSHSTIHTTTPHPTTHTTHTSTPHPTTHTSTPHPTTHTTHSSTPHPTTHTTHTSTPHPTTHTTHTSTPHPTTHTTHTSTPHPTTHTNHTSTPHPTTHTNHTSTPHPTTHTIHTSTPHTTTHHNNTTSHLTTSSATNHTTYPPTTMPPPAEYTVNDTTGVCLRITASFKITFNDTTKQEIVIPPPPSTEASGNCSAEKAWLTLTFPQGQVTITFRQDNKENKFFLGEVNITLKNTGSEKFDNTSLEDMVTPLGSYFSCEKVNVQVTSKVSFLLMDVKAQAFKLEGGNYGREMKCSNGKNNMTVAIVVGVILVVLILIVVIAYIIARRRSQRGYQPL